MPVKQEESTEVLEAKIRLNPDSMAFARLADGYRKQGDIAKAIEICKQGIKKHPSYATGRIILGRCYLEQENFSSAINEFTDVCKLDRRNQVALKVLADIYAKQQLSQKAGDLYAILFKNDPENKSLQHLSSTIPGTGKEDIFQIIGLPMPGGAEPAQEKNEWETGQLSDTFVEQPRPAQDALVETANETIDEIPGFTSIEDIQPPAPPPPPQSKPQPAAPAIPRPTEAGVTDRMAMIFQEEEATPAGMDELRETSVLTPLEDAKPETEPEVVESYSSEIQDAETISLSVAKKPSRFDGEVLGSDVSSRIDELFGGLPVPEETMQTSPLPAQPAVRAPVSPQAQKPKQPPMPKESQAGQDTMFIEEPAPAVETPQQTFETQQPDFGEISTTDLLDQVPGSTEMVDFDALPEDAGSQEQKGSDIQLTSDSAVVGDDVLTETQTDLDQPQSAAGESSVSLNVSAKYHPFDSGPIIDETKEISEEEVNEAASDRSLAGDTEIRYTPGKPPRRSTGDTTIAYSRADGPSPSDLFVDKPSLNEVDQFTDTIKFSLASDVLATKAGDDASKGTQTPQAGTSRAKPAHESNDLFGEEPLLGFDEKPAPPKPVTPLTPKTPVLPLADKQKQQSAKPPAVFSDEIASADTAVIEDLSGEQISGEDIVNKLDQIFPKGVEDFDDPILSPETERRMGDTDYFEKPIADEALSQTLAWDKNDLLSAAGKPAQPAATPLSADTLPIEDIQETLDALPDDSGDEEMLQDYYTVAGDNTGKTPAAPAPVEGLDTVEMAPPPAHATSPDIFMDEDVMSDTAVQPVDAEFSDTAIVPPPTTPEEETLAEVAPAQATESSGPAKSNELFIKQNADILASDASETVMMIPEDDIEDSSDSGTGDFYTVSGEDAGAVSGQSATPVGLDVVELDAPVETHMVEDIPIEPDFAPEPAVVDKPLDHKKPSSDQESKKIPETTAHSIPDHVLTPTLADIYFRQGQPQLALQIFKRLLEMNPANDKLRNRIVEIEQAIATGQAPLPPAGASTKPAGVPVKPRGKPGRKKKQPSTVPKPLAGVRIKKRIRENYKSSKKKK